MLEAVADDAAQPVVAVDDVDAGPVADVVEHAVGERVELVGQRLLREVVRAGRHVDDAVPGLDERPRRQAGRSARVYVVHSTPAWASADATSRT